MNVNNAINVSVLGVGYLGEYHVQQLQSIKGVNLIGIFDLDYERAEYVAKKYKTKIIDKDILIKKSDAVCIVTPTSSHYENAKEAIENNCHVFIEKPITETIEQSLLLIQLANKENLYIQVGHIERFNKAYQLLLNEDVEPEFIECHRLAHYNKRGVDVSVILDLMIHDIDLIINLKNRKINSIDANGVSVISNTIDIANSRIMFNDGCVANLTASRISQKNMRKIRVFAKNQYYGVDLLKQTLKKYSVSSMQTSKNNCIVQSKTENRNNALYDELYTFIKCIRNKTKPIVDGESGMNALDVALQIQRKIIG